jgi:hypothetical protein
MSMKDKAGIVAAPKRNDVQVDQYGALPSLAANMP